VAAIDAAIRHGFGIEIDLQLSADDAAIVFHDYGLERLTGQKGTVRATTAQAMSGLRLMGTQEVPPTLPEVLARVAGQVPLLIELKDQDGALGPNIGALEQATARALAGYAGPVALMSFNPHSVIALRDLAPDLARGLVTAAFAADDWPVPAKTRERLAAIPDFDAAGASFLSHDARDLPNPRVSELHKSGAHVLCWTIRSPEAEAEARKWADNVTFEGYLPEQAG
jgi:glycerophosphoryl diester phosphodiesterase